MDKIFINSNIYTMDENRNKYEALGVKGNKIEALGSNEELLSLKESKTKVIDLKGKTMVPGFNDSHMHLINYGYSLKQVNLIGTDSPEGINEKVKEFISKEQIKEGKWIRGRGWNQDYFKGEKRFPTKDDLDKISTEYPIVVTRICGHVGVINSKALEILNINKETPQFEGGQFDLDNEGNPIGIFREMALNVVYNSIPESSLEEVKDMIEIAINEMNKNGITSAGTDDFESLPGKDYDLVMKAYNELKSENKLTMRIYEQCLIPDIKDLEIFFERGYKTGWGDEFLKIGPLKLLVDGSLGAKTAALIRPYEDEEDNYGITLLTQEELDQLVELSSKNNTHIIIHGIGDRAMYMAFESIEKELSKSSKKDHRHGIVHCQITDKVLLDKFKELDVVAYIQPIFLDYDWNMVKSRVGEEREKTSYNWKSMVDREVKIACGSDAPVETFNVLYGIYEAVTRKDLSGNPSEGWLIDQALTVDEALYGYTMGGSFSSFEEDIKGSLEIGKLADMVVLSDDLFTVSPDNIKDIRVEKTILNGKIIYMI